MELIPLRDAAFDFWRGWGWVILKINIFISCKGTFTLTTTYEKKKIHVLSVSQRKACYKGKKVSCTHIIHTSREINS